MLQCLNLRITFFTKNILNDYSHCYNIKTPNILQNEKHKESMTGQIFYINFKAKRLSFKKIKEILHKSVFVHFSQKSQHFKWEIVYKLPQSWMELLIIKAHMRLSITWAEVWRILLNTRNSWTLGLKLELAWIRYKWRE